jgi:hypothetical protein
MIMTRAKVGFKQRPDRNIALRDVPFEISIKCATKDLATVAELATVSDGLIPAALRAWAV